MIALASDRNIDQVLLEFREYATEVDVDFVRKARAPPPRQRRARRALPAAPLGASTPVIAAVSSALFTLLGPEECCDCEALVQGAALRTPGAAALRAPAPRQAVRAIGRCAVSLERAAERCINVLLELIQTKVTYVVQEAVVVIKDIFRRYPNRCARPRPRRRRHCFRALPPKSACVRAGRRSGRARRTIRILGGRREHGQLVTEQKCADSIRPARPRPPQAPTRARRARQVRERHRHAVRVPGHTGRAGGARGQGLGHRRVRGAHRQRRRAAGGLPGGARAPSGQPLARV